MAIKRQFSSSAYVRDVEAKEVGKLTKKGKEEVQEKVGPLKNYFKDLWKNFSDGYNE